MKVLAINGSPRTNHNTGKLLLSFLEGAKSGGASTQIVNLVKLNYKPCISCFSCKLKPSYGKCALKDDLSPVLEQANEADVLIIGSPIYFAAETAYTRAFLERLFFASITYLKENPILTKAKKATALLYTMNISEKNIETWGYTSIFSKTKESMERFYHHPCEVLLVTDTKQFDDYDIYKTNLFSGVEKDKRHLEHFPKELQRLFDLGKQMIS